MRSVFTGLASSAIAAGLALCATMLFALPAVADRTIAESPQGPATESVFSRDSWIAMATALDRERLKRQFENAQKAGFPSVANEFATQLLLAPSALPERARRAAEVPEFRVEALFYLATAVRNGFLSSDRDRIKTIAKELAKTDFGSRYRAILALGILRATDAIDLVQSDLRSDDPNRFSSAAIALRLMCAERANRVLVAESERSANAEKRAFIKSSETFSRGCENRKSN